jgi:hypothetical protein
MQFATISGNNGAFAACSVRGTFASLLSANEVREAHGTNVQPLWRTAYCHVRRVTHLEVAVSESLAQCPERAQCYEH